MIGALPVETSRRLGYRLTVMNRNVSRVSLWRSTAALPDHLVGAFQALLRDGTSRLFASIT
jgi:hypothetical protein